MQGLQIVLHRFLTNMNFCQNVPYQIFLLARANAVPVTVLSIFYLSIFSQCQFVNVFPYQKLGPCGISLKCWELCDIIRIYL